MNRQDFLYSDSPWDAEYFGLIPRSACLDFGADSSDIEEQLGQTQALNTQVIQGGYGQARQDLTDQINAAISGLSPYTKAGTTGLNQYLAMLGLGPSGTASPSQLLAQTPGYDWLLSQGQTALDRSSAARGLNLSGAQLKGLTNYGQNLGLTYAYQPYMNSLSGLMGTGLNAATTSGNWQAALGSGLAGLDQWQAGALMGLNSQTTAAMIQAQNAASNANASGWNSLASGLGTLGMFALSPLGLGLGSSLTGALGLGGGAAAGLGGAAGGLSGLSSPASMASTYAAWLPTAMGGLADGGPAKSGVPYVIGERGPEVFIPDQSGMVIPNHLIPYSGFANFPEYGYGRAA